MPSVSPKKNRIRPSTALDCSGAKKKSTHSVTTIPSGSSVIIQSIWPFVCFLFIPYFLP